jgi:hypothetical protein
MRRVISFINRMRIQSPSKNREASRSYGATVTTTLLKRRSVRQCSWR